MTLGALSISFGGSILFFLLCAAIAVGAAFFFYRFTLPPLPRGTRLTLSVLRSLSLALLLLLLFEPVARLTTTTRQEPVIAVLVDNTQSMTIRDAAGDRAAALRAFLSSNG